MSAASQLRETVCGVLRYRLIHAGDFDKPQTRISQRLQYPLIKEYSSSNIRDLTIYSLFNGYLSLWVSLDLTATPLRAYGGLGFTSQAASMTVHA